MNVYEQDIYIENLDDLAEAGACGTAATITPIGSITYQGIKHIFPAHKEMGEVTRKLYQLLSGIQYGDIEDPNHWVTLL
jgi:branched-chain amino acid aminotransferase